VKARLPAPATTRHEFPKIKNNEAGDSVNKSKKNCGDAVQKNISAQQRRRLLALSLTAALAFGLAPLHAATAADYPKKPLKMVIPFPPGGPNDMLGRLLAEEMGKNLGQAVVVENRGGAGGTIGTDVVAKANPDGYTILLSGTASLSIAPSLYKHMNYDPIKDLSPVGLVGTAPSVLLVNPKLPFKNVAELIAYAKANPGKLNFASAGIGTPPHLAGELFKSMAGADMVHVPYKGGGPAMVDLIAGQVQMYFCGISSALPQIKQGTVRPLAVTSEKPTTQMPDMPTIAASGLPGYAVENWYAIVAPAHTPAPIVERLNTALNKILAEPNVKKQMALLGIDPQGSTPAELATYQKNELEKWAKVVKSAGIQPE
jgi:tripartite-type tricarboxylate transporter receptor subunit TctC